MKKANVVDLIAILDRSGSMGGKEEDVIGGFNEFIAAQRKVPGEACVTLVLFDEQYQVVHNRVPLQDVPELTKETYHTRGSTALLDAVGKTLKSAESAKKAIVFIFTDGQENASKEWKLDAVKRLVEDRQKKGWDINFIGADIDAYADAMVANLGIAKAALKIPKNKVGLRQMTAYMSAETVSYRSGGDSN
jgi:uncharacterized protein YegL